MAITLKELANQKRRQRDKERKHIESFLHPEPVINGITILHEHRGFNIRFSAWKGDDPLNTRYLEWDRDDFIMMPEGYDFYNKELKTHFDYLTGAWPPAQHNIDKKTA